jgi:chromosome partitioning protein
MRPKGYVNHLREQKPTTVQIFDNYRPATKDNPGPTPISIDEIILKGAGFWANSTLDLIPCRLELARTMKTLAGRERRLAKELAKVATRYDLVVIDCPPTESILTDAAYFASRYVLVPVKPEFMAAIGLPLLARSLTEFKLENGDHEIDICGVVFNHSSTYSSGPENRQAIADVRKIAVENGWPIFPNHIKYSASYAKSAREGAPISKTSHVRWNVAAGFEQFRTTFFKSIGMEGI